MESYESTTRRMKAELPGLCALIQDTLPFYLEGDVSARSRQFVEQHLEECERCASFLAGGRSVQAHFRREQGTRSVVMVRDRPGRELIAEGQRRVLKLGLMFAGVVAILVFIAVVLGSSVRSVPTHGFSSSESLPFMSQATPTPAPFEPTALPPTVVPAP